MKHPRKSRISEHLDEATDRLGEMGTMGQEPVGLKQISVLRLGKALSPWMWKIHEDLESMIVHDSRLLYLSDQFCWPHMEVEVCSCPILNVDVGKYKGSLKL